LELDRFRDFARDLSSLDPLESEAREIPLRGQREQVKRVDSSGLGVGYDSCHEVGPQPVTAPFGTNGD
jgi:hypothetical protein